MSSRILTEIIKSIIVESIDLYKISDFDKLGIDYEIKKSNRYGLEVNLKSKKSELTYQVVVSISYRYGNKLIPTINFGVYDTDTGSIDLSTDTKSPSTPLILACVFGIFREWLDQNNTLVFHYKASDNVRQTLYRLYLEKHFKDYDLLERIKNDFIWKKKD